MSRAFTISGAQVILDDEDAMRFVGVRLEVASNGYVAVRKLGCRSQYIHRVIMGAPDGTVVDHINGNKLDNRRSNLRICLQSENCLNHKVDARSTTGVTGVRWDKHRLQWAAQIAVGNRTIPLGRFNEFEEAVAARKAAEQKYHGKFSCSEGVQRDKG